jgi:hypothetical protein
VSIESDIWIPGHFAGLDESKTPLVFINGRTSFTTSSRTKVKECVKRSEITQEMEIVDYLN